MTRLFTNNAIYMPYNSKLGQFLNHPYIVHVANGLTTNTKFISLNNIVDVNLYSYQVMKTVWDRSFDTSSPIMSLIHPVG